MKLPYSKWYHRDHASDPARRSCSLAARGLWDEMLQLMGMNDSRKGFLEAGGKPLLDPKEIARHTASDVEEVTRCLDELERAGVFSRDENSGCIYSRRMVKDARITEIRQQAGSQGGNPQLTKSTQNLSLLNQNLKQKLNQPAKQTVGSGTGILNSSQKGECEGETQVLAIYEAYPKKVGKPSALRAIGKALKKIAFDELLAKTRAYAEWIERAKPKLEFIPHPATWFNDERYNDALSAVAPASVVPTIHRPSESTISDTLS